MAEYGREGCIELSSYCAQSLHICPKGNAHTLVMGGNTVSETFTSTCFTSTCFSSEVCHVTKTGPDSLFRA